MMRIFTEQSGRVVPWRGRRFGKAGRYRRWTPSASTTLRRLCAACESDVREWPPGRSDELGFCADCLERARTAVADDELGGD